MFKHLTSLLLLSCTLFSFSARPAVIKITKVSNLVIGKVVQGDPAKLIPCGTTENASNASFQVTGNANTAYTITLPASGALKLTGGADLVLTNFQSYPAAGANGLLPATGKQLVFVGATLSAIPSTQKAGNYSGSFTINVVY